MPFDPVLCEILIKLDILFNFSAEVRRSPKDLIEELFFDKFTIYYILKQM